MKKKMVLMMLLLPTVVFAADAWWVKARFTPWNRFIMGVPVETIHSDFNRATLLTLETVSKRHPEAVADLKKNNAVFEVNWIREGKTHKVVVGIYTGDNDKGSFIAVFEKEKAKWKPIFVEKASGNTGLGILQENKDSILWNTCLDCGHGAVLVWKKDGGYTFEKYRDDVE